MAPTAWERRKQISSTPHKPDKFNVVPMTTAIIFLPEHVLTALLGGQWNRGVKIGFNLSHKGQYPP